jgi:transposase
MGKSQPTYTKEFKQQAVQLFEASGKSKTQIARDLGISDSALSKWCKEFGERGEEAFPGKGHQTTIEKEEKKSTDHEQPASFSHRAKSAQARFCS